MMPNEFFFIAIIGFLQIILEFLPVSSSSHIFLVEQFLKKYGINPPLNFSLSSFENVLHGETLVLIFIFFRSHFFLFFSALLPFRSITAASRKRILFYCLKLILFLMLSTGITLVPYLLIKYLCSSLSSSCLLLQCFGIGLTALLLYASSFSYQRTLSSFSVLILLSIAQGLAAFPGVSRLGSTYAVGKILGLRADKAVYYSFLLHMPLCFGGFLLGTYKMIQAHSLSFLVSPSLLITFFIASLISYEALYGTYRLAIKNKMYWISFYLIIPCIASFFLYAFKYLN